MFPSRKWRHVWLFSTQTLPQHLHSVCGSRVMDCRRPAKSPSSSPPSHISPPISTPASPSSPSPSSVSSSNGLHVSTQPFLSSVNHGAEAKGGPRCGWELQRTEGKLQILDYCVLYSRYDVVSVSTSAKWRLSVSSIFIAGWGQMWKCGMNLWWEVDAGRSQEGHSSNDPI